MLPTPTLDKLHGLKLPAMAQAWTEQQRTADLHALSFDERFGLLVDAEWLARENKRLARALQEAKLKLPQACLATNILGVSGRAMLSAGHNHARDFLSRALAEKGGQARQLTGRPASLRSDHDP